MKAKVHVASNTMRLVSVALKKKIYLATALCTPQDEVSHQPSSQGTTELTVSTDKDNKQQVCIWQQS